MKRGNLWIFMRQSDFINYRNFSALVYRFLLPHNEYIPATSAHNDEINFVLMPLIPLLRIKFQVNNSVMIEHKTSGIYNFDSFCCRNRCLHVVWVFIYLLYLLFLFHFKVENATQTSIPNPFAKFQIKSDYPWIPTQDWARICEQKIRKLRMNLVMNWTRNSKWEIFKRKFDIRKGWRKQRERRFEVQTKHESRLISF
jgi:hypothetical protein